MRKLQKLFWSLMIVTLVGGFSACSNADDDDLSLDGPGSGGTVDPTAPVNYLKEDFNSLENNGKVIIEGWTTELVESGETGTSYTPRNWQGKVYNNDAYVQGNAYNCPDGNYEFWLFTPALNVKDAAEKVFSFETVLYTGGTANNTTAEVYVMQTNNSADPAKVKIEISSLGDGSQNFISTGDLSLEGKGDVVYIGFRYRVDGYVYGTDVKTWRVDNFLFGASVSDPGPSGGNGSGTQTDPYDIAAAKFHQGETYKWVKGYIVGQCNGMNLSTAVFEAPFEPGSSTTGEGTNMLIAATADIKDATQCLIVKLVGDLRNMSLVKDADNLGKEILLQGSLETYFGTAGIVPNAGILDGTTYGSIISDPDAMFNVPAISVSDLRALYTADGKLTEEKKIVGIVISDKTTKSMNDYTFVLAAEDNSAGIAMHYAVGTHPYALGDKVEIALNGMTLQKYQNLLQLEGDGAMTRKIGEGSVTPVVTTIPDIMNNWDRYESTLVTITGTIDVTSSTTFKGSHDIVNGSDKIVLYTRTGATFQNDVIPTGEKKITGMVAVYGATKQLIIRSSADVTD